MVVINRFNGLVHTVDAKTGANRGPEIALPTGCTYTCGPTARPCSSSTRVRLVSLSTGKPLGPDLAFDGAAKVVAWADDSKHVAIALASGKVQLWDPVEAKMIGTGLSLRRQADRDIDWPVQFTPDARKVLVAEPVAEGLSIGWREIASGQASCR